MPVAKTMLLSLVSLMDWLRRPGPVLYAIVTLLAAAALVAGLQYRHLQALNRQTEVMLHAVAERTAEAITTEIERTFQRPLHETLLAVNPPAREDWLSLVAAAYHEGLPNYPQVERFFLWHASTEPIAPGAVIFFGGQSVDAASMSRPLRVPLRLPLEGAQIERFYDDRPLGQEIFDIGRQHQYSKLPFAVGVITTASATYDVVWRFSWMDSQRQHLLGMLGYIVNHETVRTRVFNDLNERKLRHLLVQRDGATPQLQLQIIDDDGRVVLGPDVVSARPASARTTLRLIFYPVSELAPLHVAGFVPDRRWSIVVSPQTAIQTDLIASGYWLSGTAILLMLMALGFSLRGRKRMIELSQMQADFVAHVSHQLRTPLSLLSAVAETTIDLNRVRSPEKLAHYLRLVQRETARLSVLVDRILEFSRVQSRTRAFEPEEVDLTELAHQTVEAFQEPLKNDGWVIAVEDCGPPATVRADPAALEQILANLLDNAVKYSNGRRDITVRVGQVGSAGVLEVSDRGIGVPAADHSRIFERFYRGAGVSTHGTGFGLGLAIVRELVHVHDGQVEVESRAGDGSTFRVRLPLLRRRRRSARSWLGFDRRPRHL